MSNSLNVFLATVRSGQPVAFQDTMTVIAEYYDYRPTGFSNGQGDDMIENAAGVNEGSCKIFSFAQLHWLSEPETLALFGDYYRTEVLGNPDGESHKNIRAFLRFGWPGIRFEGSALTAKEAPGSDGEAREAL